METTENVTTQPSEDARLRAAVRDEWSGFPDSHWPLLIALRDKYGLNVDPDAEPRELLGMKWYGDPRFFESPRLVIVTCGGLKISEPLDQESEERLRHVFGAFKRVRDPRTGDVQDVPLPLPADQRLPQHKRDGLTPPQRG